MHIHYRSVCAAALHANLAAFHVQCPLRVMLMIQMEAAQSQHGNFPIFIFKKLLDERTLTQFYINLDPTNVTEITCNQIIVSKKRPVG